MSDESLAKRVEEAAAWDDYCGNKDCPRGCGSLVELVEAIRALETRYQALRDAARAFLDTEGGDAYARLVELVKADQPAPTDPAPQGAQRCQVHDPDPDDDGFGRCTCEVVK